MAIIVKVKPLKRTLWVHGPQGKVKVKLDFIPNINDAIDAVLDYAKTNGHGPGPIKQIASGPEPQYLWFVVGR